MIDIRDMLYYRCADKQRGQSICLGNANSDWRLVDLVIGLSG